MKFKVIQRVRERITIEIIRNHKLHNTFFFSMAELVKSECETGEPRVGVAGVVRNVAIDHLGTACFLHLQLDGLPHRTCPFPIS